MKKLLIALLGTATIGFTHAATIQFFQDSSFQYPVQAKGQAISGIDANNWTNLPNGSTFTIANVAQGVQNTTLSVDAFSSPNIPYLAAGSLSWTNYSGTTYEFDISAGGNPGQWDPKTSYCIDVVVDGKDIGSNCTSTTTYWAPKVAKATLNNSSKIQVFFSLNGKKSTSDSATAIAGTGRIFY